MGEEAVTVGLAIGLFIGLCIGSFLFGCYEGWREWKR